MSLRVRESAVKHGSSIEDISHAVDMALRRIEIDPDNDPPKLLLIGPDSAGNLLELVGAELAGGVLLIWHAKKCRDEYLQLLPKSGGGA